MTLFLHEIAQMNKRNFCMFHFRSEEDYLKIIQVRKNGKNVISKVTDIAEYWLGSSTDFMKPWGAAMEIIQTEEFSKADIEFITDGYCAVDDE